MSLDHNIQDATEAETAGLGVIVAEGISNSFSDIMSPEEAGEDLLRLVEDFLYNACRTDGGFVRIITVDNRVAGAAQIIPRDLLRSRHVADVRLTIRPAFRRQGWGRRLLKDVTIQSRSRGILRKLCVTCAEDDHALVTLLSRENWELERREIAGMRRDGAFVDRLTYYHHWMHTRDSEEQSRSE